MDNSPTRIAGTRMRRFVQDQLRVNRLVHHLETAAISCTILVGLTLFVFGLRFESWVHEWANFLKHYSVAPATARLPVNIVIVVIYLMVFVIVWLGRRKKVSAHVQ